MKRLTTGLSLVIAAGVVLAGCSSGGTTAASSSATLAATSSAAPTSAAATTSAAQPTVSAPLSATGATLTAGGGTSELDEQTTEWFSTFCSGLAGLGDLQSISSAQQAGQVLQDVGTKMTDTGQQLATLPPPTFDGGDATAETAIQLLDQVGPAFVSFGQRAATIKEDDQAAAQQFATDFQAELAPLQGLTQIKLDPETQQAVSAIPECSQTMGAVSGSGAPMTS